MQNLVGHRIWIRENEGKYRLLIISLGLHYLNYDFTVGYRKKDYNSRREAIGMLKKCCEVKRIKEKEDYSSEEESYTVTRMKL